MTWMSKRGESFSIGIDISDSSIKALVLKHSNSGYSVESCERLSLPTATLIAREIKHSDSLIQALKQLRFELAPLKHRVVAALSDQLVVNKTIIVPTSLTDLEIEAEISLAMSNDQTTPHYDLYFDYKTLKNPPDMANKAVAFVAAKQSTVRSYQQACLDAGWHLTILDVESHAIAAIWPVLASNYDVVGQAVAIFDLGHTRGLLTIINRDGAIFNRVINLAGAHITQQLAEYYQCSLVEAERTKLGGCFVADCQENIIRPFLQLISKQLQHWLQYFTVVMHADAVSTLFLTGGCTNLLGFDSWLAEELQIKVKKIDPFEGWQFTSIQMQDRLRSDANAWFLSYILAMRGFTHERI